VDELDLLDWKRHVSELYARVRREPEPVAAWELWRRERERLFREHPQSPVPADERASYTGPHVFDYDPAWRLSAAVKSVAEQSFDLPSSDGGTMTMRRFAVARAEGVELELYWLEGYGGGLYVPFADATSGVSSFGGGRYLLDTVKGADLGIDGARLVLDFNFAYNPSCAYDPRWTCPLSPLDSRLEIPVGAGELLPPG